MEEDEAGSMAHEDEATGGPPPIRLLIVVVPVSKLIPLPLKSQLCCSLDAAIDISVFLRGRVVLNDDGAS